MVESKGFTIFIVFIIFLLAIGFLLFVGGEEMQDTGNNSANNDVSGQGSYPANYGFSEQDVKLKKLTVNHQLDSRVVSA